MTFLNFIFLRISRLQSSECGHGKSFSPYIDAELACNPGGGAIGNLRTPSEVGSEIISY
jgi:hypothetical protein